MNRDKTLRILLVLFGLIFLAAVYPLITSVRSGWQANREDAEPMGLSLCHNGDFLAGGSA
jgi:hypothetical protein